MKVDCWWFENALHWECSLMLQQHQKVHVIDWHFVWKFINVVFCGSRVMCLLGSLLKCCAVTCETVRWTLWITAVCLPCSMWLIFFAGIYRYSMEWSLRRHVCVQSCVKCTRKSWPNRRTCSSILVTSLERNWFASRLQVLRRWTLVLQLCCLC